MSESEKQLLVVLKERSLRLDGPFQLASGGISDYYIDGKLSEVFSRGSYLIGEVLYERTKGQGIVSIGGLEAGAIPLTTAAVISYHLRGESMEGFWVRDQLKSHGTKKLIEGKPLPRGARVAIVDDVVTEGKSALKAIDEVRKAGCEVALVIALVDRLCGAEELFRENGIENYQPVFTIRDLGVNVDVRRPATSTAR